MKSHRPHHLLAWLLLGTLAAAAAAFLLLPEVVNGRTDTQPARADAAPRAITPRGPLEPDERALIDLFRKASPFIG